MKCPRKKPRVLAVSRSVSQRISVKHRVFSVKSGLVPCCTAEIRMNPQGIRQAVLVARMDAANLHIITETRGTKQISSSKADWWDQYIA